MAQTAGKGWSVSPASLELLPELVVTRENAFDIGEEAHAQAVAILADAEGWTEVALEGGGCFETKPVAGVFGPSGILMTRNAKEVGASADTVFRMLISPEGYSVIDPMCNPEEFDKHLERFEGWRPQVPGAKLEVSNAFAHLGKGKASEFVILNSHDPASRLFASTSMMHQSRPGGSRYQNEMVRDGPETKRILNTFAVQCVPVSADRCRVKFFNWMEFGMGKPDRENMMSAMFWVPLWERLDKWALTLEPQAKL